MKYKLLRLACAIFHFRKGIAKVTTPQALPLRKRQKNSSAMLLKPLPRRMPRQAQDLTVTILPGCWGPSSSAYVKHYYWASPLLRFCKQLSLRLSTGLHQIFLQHQQQTLPHRRYDFRKTHIFCYRRVCRLRQGYCGSVCGPPQLGIFGRSLIPA